VRYNRRQRYFCT